MAVPIRPRPAKPGPKPQYRPLPDRVDRSVRTIWTYARAADMSQTDLAKASGISRTMVGYLLRGRGYPTTLTAEALASAVGCHLEVVPDQLDRQP